MVLSMVSVPDELPSLTLDDASVPLEHQFEVFRAATAPLFDARPILAALDTPAQARDYLVDGLIVSRLRYGRMILRRTGRHLDVAGDTVSVLLPARGGLRGSIGDGSSLELDPAHVVIFDFARPFACCCDDTEMIWVMVPRARLGRSSWPQRTPVVRFHRTSPRGRVLAAAIEHLWDEVGRASASRGPELAAGVVDAIGAVLRPGDFAPDDASLERAIKDYVAENLDDLTLDHRALQVEFFCSRSALYRVFRSEEGVDRYIRKQRLIRCFDELASRSAATRPVASVATRWGFENPSHFNRVFKATFGVPPSSVVERRHHEPTNAVSSPSSHGRPGLPAWLAAL